MQAVFCCLLLLAVAVPPAVSDEFQPLPVAAVASDTLYVQTAAGTNVTFHLESEFTFTLQLFESSPKTTWFADRPVRQAGRMANDQFLYLIGDTKPNPVNSAIVANLMGADEPANVLPVELWNGHLSDEGSTIVYTGRLLEPNSTLPLNFDKVYASPIDREEVMALVGDTRTMSLEGDVELFIDGARGRCKGPTCKRGEWGKKDGACCVHSDCEYGLKCCNNDIGCGKCSNPSLNACWFGGNGP